MNTTTKFILISGLSFLIFSCNSSRNSEMEQNERISTDSISPNGFISSSAAVETGKDTSHKFVRTAEMKFRVKNVFNATYQIEDFVKQYNGFVTYTNLTSNKDFRTITAISADSSLETINFTVSNVMTIRIPNIKLDSTLKSIATLIEYLDYRKIKADDVKLQMLSNKLTQDRMNKPETQFKTVIENGNKKVIETRHSTENLLYKQEIADNSKISNLSLQDQVNFSTVTISIYQRQETKRWLIFNEKNIEAYEPSFGMQIIDSLKFGWNILEAFILFFVKLWGIIVFVILIYFLFLKFRHKFKLKK